MIANRRAGEKEDMYNLLSSFLDANDDDNLGGEPTLTDPELMSIVLSGIRKSNRRPVRELSPSSKMPVA